jgi:hypothetical protein
LKKIESMELFLFQVGCEKMDQQPKTRQESKKNQGKKGRPEKLGSGKGTRIKIANLEKAAARNTPSETKR